VATSVELRPRYCLSCKATRSETLTLSTARGKAVAVESACRTLELRRDQVAAAMSVPPMSLLPALQDPSTRSSHRRDLVVALAMLVVGAALSSSWLMLLLESDEPAAASDIPDWLGYLGLGVFVVAAFAPLLILAALAVLWQWVRARRVLSTYPWQQVSESSASSLGERTFLSLDGQRYAVCYAWPWRKKQLRNLAELHAVGLHGPHVVVRPHRDGPMFLARRPNRLAQGILNRIGFGSLTGRTG
jgi:hypothetical protein